MLHDQGWILQMSEWSWPESVEELQEEKEEQERTGKTSPISMARTPAIRAGAYDTMEIEVKEWLLIANANKTTEYPAREETKSAKFSH